MPLHLLPATKADIPTIVNIYFTTFKSPLVLSVKPDVPPVREWYRKNLESDMNKSFTHVYKVVESEGDVVRKEDEIIAFAKWSAPHEELQGPEAKKVEGKEDDWPADGDVALFKEVVAKATAKKNELVGGKESWYLASLATLPQHQRRGAASMLMAEFCRQIDEAGNWGYVEASPKGKATYERFGFVTRGRFVSLIEGEEYVDCCMVREPREGR